MKISQIHDLQGLQPHKTAWDRLAAEGGPVVPEQTFAVTHAFLKHKLPPGAEWTALLAFDDERLVGTLTLIHGRRLGAPGLSLQVFKTPFDFFHTECGSVLLAPGYEDLLISMLQALRKAQRCLPVIGLMHLPADDRLVASASTLALQIGLVQRPLPGENVVRIEGDFATYQQSLQAKFRRELHRRERRLGEQVAISYRFDGDPANNLENLRLFTEIENSGWKGTDRTSILTRPGDEAFFADATQGLAAAGQMDWGFLEAGGEAIAGQLMVRINRRLFVWKVGYREDYAAYAPSNLLLYRYLETVYQRGDADELAFGSDRPYQREFRPDYRPYRNLILFPRLPGLASSIGMTLSAKQRVTDLIATLRRRLQDRRRCSCARLFSGPQGPRSNAR